MKFLMIEDLHGTVEVTLFPRAYERVGHRLHGAGPYLITGTVREQHGALTLDGEDVTRLLGGDLKPDLTDDPRGLQPNQGESYS